MTKKEKRELTERGLTLYSTGRFSSRQEAYDEAVNEKKRIQAKKNKPEELRYKHNNQTHGGYFGGF